MRERSIADVMLPVNIKSFENTGKNPYDSFRKEVSFNSLKRMKVDTLFTFTIIFQVTDK